MPDRTAGASADAVPLDRVVVKGQALRGANAPFSVDAFNADSVRALHVSHPQELFRQVPGMAVRNFGLAGVADSIVLRGFGGGGHGGDLGVVIDGIPLNEAMSHADGYVDLNVIVPLEIGGLTVYKGPVSALFGNYNRSGLIAFETRKEALYGNADVSASNHGTFDAQAAWGLAASAVHRVNLAAQHYRTNGFRPQSGFERTTVAGRWAINLTPTTEVAVAARSFTGGGDSPSYLTREQFDRDPYGIDPRVQRDGSDRDLAMLRADLSTTLSERLRLLAYAYGTAQSFTRWYTRPVSPVTWAQREESYDRAVRGGGASLNGRERLTAGALNWVAGMETFRESTDYRFYDGLSQRRRVSPAIYDRTAELNSVSGFSEIEAPLRPWFKPWVALRYDRFTGEAVRNGPETGADPVGAMAAVDHLSPKLGIRSDFGGRMRLRASWAEGFALAPNFVKYALGAANLDPNVFRQTEVGAAWQFGRSVAVDVALYRIQSSDEILTVGPGVYQNFGATRRSGLESKLEWRMRADWSASATYGRATSRIGRNVSAMLLGRQVTGVPDHTVTLHVARTPQLGWGAEATLRYVGRFAVDAANTLFASSYTTLDLGLSHAAEWRGRRYKLYLVAENAADRVHATTVSLTNGFQILAPGAPLTFKLGAQFDL
jgi:outer membrane receptor protein involved in Fe transport